MLKLIRNNCGQSSSSRIERNQINAFQGVPVKISVIIPVYNAENFLDDTLASIEKQTLHDIEIICVNDASTDNSLAILERHMLKDPRIVIISNSCNSGTGATINLGISLACGKYLQYVGNDDLLEPWALETLYNLCEENDIDFCQYAIRVFNDDPDDSYLAERARIKEEYHRVLHDYPILPGQEILALAVQRGEYCMSNGPQMVRHSLLENEGIKNLEGLHHEDMFYTYRVLLSAQRAKIITEPLYLYRIRRGSLETTKESRLFTAEEFEALLLSASEMASATPANLYCDPIFMPVIETEIEYYLARAGKHYVAMSQAERDKIVRPDNKIAASTYSTIKAWSIEHDKISKELEKTRKSLKKIKASRSYKVGHALLAPARHIKKIFKRLRLK